MNAKYYIWGRTAEFERLQKEKLERLKKQEKEEFERFRRREKALLKDNFYLLVKINELETKNQELHLKLERYNK